MEIYTLNNLYRYDQQSGTISYNNIDRRKFISGPAIDISTLPNLKTSEEMLGIKVTISEESQVLFAQALEAKQQTELNTLSGIYESIGMSDKAPKTFCDISATDRALLTQQYNIMQDGVNTVYAIWYDGGFLNGENAYATMERNAFDIAIQHEYLTNYFSDTSITERINSMNLPSEADKELLFQASKAYGDKVLNEFSKSVMTAIKAPSEEEARRLSRLLGTPSSESEKERTNFKESFEKLFLETTERAKELIRQGYSGDIVEKLKDDSYNNSSVRFDFKGVSLNRKQLEDVARTLDNANNAIYGTGYNNGNAVGSPVYKELAKLHADIYKKAQSELSWLSSDEAEKVLTTVKEGSMKFTLDQLLMRDASRLIADEIRLSGGGNGGRINVGEFVRNNPILQGYAKDYEKEFLLSLK